MCASIDVTSAARVRGAAFKAARMAYRMLARGRLEPALRLLRDAALGGFGLRRRRTYVDDYSYQKEWLRHIPDLGTILDIGSGHNPFPRATVLGDRYTEITAHRREELVRDSRPFVIFDIHHLPFKSQSFDYIYCTHVMEHVEDPALACAELMRVGKAGYIETPTLMKDAFFSWAQAMSHKWYVVQFGNGLVFFEYDERRAQGLRSKYWQETVLGAYRHRNQDLFYRNLDIFNSCLEWKGGFDVTVFRLGQSLPTLRPFRAQAGEPATSPMP